MSAVKFILKVVAAFFIVLLLIGILMGAAAPTEEELREETSAFLNEINVSVATDAETQYQMTKVSGNQIDRCVQAGMVAAAWLQAQDNDKFAHWKDVEDAECSRAGIVR